MTTDDDNEHEGDKAMVYQIWRLDCITCGFVGDYDQDGSWLPDRCPECGAEAER